MERAFELARQALSKGEVPVGCVFVTEQGTHLATACNDVNRTNDASRHAEMLAIASLAPSTPDWTLLTCVVNVEPCVMCAAALLHLRVGRVVYACANSRFGGLGSVLDVRSLQSVPLSPLVMQVQVQQEHKDQAVQLLKQFYAQSNQNAPCPKVKTK